MPENIDTTTDPVVDPVTTDPVTTTDPVAPSDPIATDPADPTTPAVTVPVTEAAATRKYASAGWEGIFKISTRLLGEKEIDIDDREANILLTLEMETIDPWEFKFENLHVVLKVTPTGPNQNISINGVTQGPLVLFDRADSHELFPGAALNKQLTLKTGVFSTDELNADSALEGLKKYDIDIDYDVIPLIGETRNTSYTQLVFYVADD